MKKKRFILIIALVLLAIGAGSVYAATKCGRCSGTGIVTCTACRGSGKSRNGVQHANGTFTANKCLACNGRGYNSHQTCGGTGWLK